MNKLTDKEADSLILLFRTFGDPTLSGDWTGITSRVPALAVAWDEHRQRVKQSRKDFLDTIECLTEGGVR